MAGILSKAMYLQKISLGRLLRDRRLWVLSAPGMPVGSPGMEMGENKEPLEKLRVLENGETQVFNSHAPQTSV